MKKFFICLAVLVIALIVVAIFDIKLANDLLIFFVIWSPAILFFLGITLWLIGKHKNKKKTEFDLMYGNEYKKKSSASDLGLTFLIIAFCIIVFVIYTLVKFFDLKIDLF